MSSTYRKLRERCKYCGMTYDQAHPTVDEYIMTDDGDYLTNKISMGHAHCSNRKGHDFGFDKISYRAKPVKI